MMTEDLGGPRRFSQNTNMARKRAGRVAGRGETFFCGIAAAVHAMPMHVFGGAASFYVQ